MTDELYRRRSEDILPFFSILRPLQLDTLRREGDFMIVTWKDDMIVCSILSNALLCSKAVEMMMASLFLRSCLYSIGRAQRIFNGLFVPQGRYTPACDSFT